MVGKFFSHYQITDKLGEGGMGIVYRAHDTKLDRDVALKFLPPHLTKSEQDKARFLQEAKAASAIEHPNVCVIHDIQEHENQHFIVMQYIKGQTLKDKLRDGRLDLKDTIDLAIQIVEALKAAHSKGIVHRDIKSENIMVTETGQVKVMDFGLAKLRGSVKLTKTSSTIGTAAYMSPEHIEGKEIDARSDIFSFGVVLYEMLTGQLPFRGEYDSAMMYAIVNEEHKPVSKLQSGVPDDLEHIVHKTLKKKPEERYQTVNDLLVDLRDVMRPESHDKSKSVSKAKRPLMKYVYSFVVLIVVVILSILSRKILLIRGNGVVDSIAVLPLENLSDDPTQEYFVDGMTDALISELAKISALRVISRTSVMQYKEIRKPLPEIARELDVDALIEGTVLRSGNQIRITVQLLQADPERHLWTDDYVRDLQDIIQMQKEVTRSIAQEVNVSVTQAEQARLTDVQTLNPEAHEAYLKGRYYWHQRTEEGILKATEFFQQAIEIDPEYALAYSGLADCYQVVPAFYMLLPTEVYPKARAAAIRALELDDNLAEAYTSLGAVKHNLDWAFSDAEDLYKKAISLNPNYATAHQWYSELLMALGRHDEALMEIERAHELDPFSPIINVLRGDVYLYARQYDLAIERYQEALDLHPNFTILHLDFSTTYSLMNMHEEAIRIAQKAVNITDNPVPIINLGYIYTRSGQKDKALEQLRIMQNLPDQELLKYAERLAILYCGLGDMEKVFYWLEKAYEQHDVLISFINVEPQYDPVRSDLRFGDLLRRLGLEE